MKRKRLLSVLLVAVMTIAFAITGCLKDEAKDTGGDKKIQSTSVNKPLHEEFAEVEVTHSIENTASFFGKINVNSALFSDTSVRFAENIFEEFAGKTHLRAPFAAKVEAKVTKDGWVYVLARAKGQKKSPQETLEEQGFEIVKTLTTARQSICTSGGEKIKNTVLLGKEAKVGDTINYEGWGVLICSGTVKNTFEPHDISTLERISPRSIVKVNLDTDGQFAFTTNLPDSLKVVGNAWKRHYYAYEGGIYINGELREDIYIAKVHDNVYIIYFPFFDMKATAGMELKISGIFTDGKKAMQLKPQTFVYDGAGSWVEQK